MVLCGLNLRMGVLGLGPVSSLCYWVVLSIVMSCKLQFCFVVVVVVLRQGLTM